MYTELVGNFEATQKADLNAVNFNPSALMRAQALGLMETVADKAPVEVYDCQSGCSATNTWGCNRSPATLNQESLLAAALAA